MSGNGNRHHDVPKSGAQTHTMADIPLLYADISRVQASREEFELLFGHVLPDEPATVELSRRIVMTPFTARRLATALDAVLQERETALRSPAVATSTAAAAERLVSLVDSLGVEYGCEHSFKLQAGRMLDNRFLLGVHVPSLNVNLEPVCERLGMPAEYLHALLAELPQVNIVHFAFEEGNSGCSYKVYAEYGDAFRRHGTSGEPVLLHTGYKWDPLGSSRRCRSYYNCRPGLSRQAVLQRVRSVLAGQEEVFEAVTGIIERAGRRTKDMLYLEVSESGNPRRSFDINLYPAGLQMRDCAPCLAAMGRYHGIADFPVFFEGVQNETFGHLAGGINREGNPFLTIYFGVHGCLPGSKQGLRCE